MVRNVIAAACTSNKIFYADIKVTIYMIQYREYHNNMFILLIHVHEIVIFSKTVTRNQKTTIDKTKTYLNKI